MKMHMRHHLRRAFPIILHDIPVLDPRHRAEGAGDDGEPFAEFAGCGAGFEGFAAAEPVVVFIEGVGDVG